MFDLIAYREQTGNRQRFVLTVGDHLLGRSERVELSMPWEPCLSMHHLRLAVAEQHIDAHDTGSNPVFFRGEIQKEFRLRDGDCFVVGETVFQIARYAEADSSTQDRMIEEIAFDAGQLSNIPFSDADKRIEVLTHLPELIQDTHTEEDFFLKIAQLLLAGVPRSDRRGRGLWRFCSERRAGLHHVGHTVLYTEHCAEHVQMENANKFLGVLQVVGPHSAAAARLSFRRTARARVSSRVLSCARTSSRPLGAQHSLVSV